MEMAVQVLHDELTVNEERFTGQLQQWRKVAKAQRKCVTSSFTWCCCTVHFDTAGAQHAVAAQCIVKG
jgi:hypothetical protein